MKTKNKKAVSVEAKKAIVHAVTTAAKATVAKFFSLNSSGRESIQALYGYGTNAFNTYVGKLNISTEAFNRMGDCFADVMQWLLIGEGRSAYYVIQGDGGLHGGACEVFTFPIAGEDRQVLRHSNGAWCFADSFKGLRVVSQEEIIAIAQKGNDLRKFKNIEFETEKETLLAGAVIGDMKEKRQALVVHNGKALDVVCLTTGKIGDGEKTDRAVEIGALSEADKDTLRATLFDGIIRGRRITDERNTTRKARKLALK